MHSSCFTLCYKYQNVLEFIKNSGISNIVPIFLKSLHIKKSMNLKNVCQSQKGLMNLKTSSKFIKMSMNLKNVCEFEKLFTNLKKPLWKSKNLHEFYNLLEISKIFEILILEK